MNSKKRRYMKKEGKEDDNKVTVILNVKKELSYEN